MTGASTTSSRTEAILACSAQLMLLMRTVLECGSAVSWRRTDCVLLTNTSAPHRTTACPLVENVMATAGKDQTVGVCVQPLRTLSLQIIGWTVTRRLVPLIPL